MEPEKTYMKSKKIKKIEDNFDIFNREPSSMDEIMAFHKKMLDLGKSDKYIIISED